jgi:hypothetical protein
VNLTVPIPRLLFDPPMADNFLIDLLIFGDSGRLNIVPSYFFERSNYSTGITNLKGFFNN